mgnify:FL=1
METQPLGLGVMLDCSRGAVMHKTALKRYIDLLAKMGYKTLMLYTEDTYEVEGEPYFGYRRGRYSIAELREIDAYAAERGISLVPCIQTLAHLDGLMRWSCYRKFLDTDNILLVDDDRTYALIERMFTSLEKAFTSRRVHIGMDEAWRVGLGKFLEQHGFEKRTDILLRHLSRVTEIAARHGFRPMMWSDMFFLLATGGGYRPDAAFSEDVIAKVPRDLDLVYWDYYHFDKDFYTGVLRVHQKFRNPIIFAGGLWTWRGFSPLSEQALAATDAAMAACRETGCRDVFFTLWGDDGGECSYFAALPTLFYAAQAVGGVPDPGALRRAFREATGEDYDDLMLLGKIGNYSGNPEDWFFGTAKTWFYQDPLLGYYDRTVPEGAPAYYAALADKIDAAAERSASLGTLLRTEAAYARAIGLKCRLGVRARTAYLAEDRAALLTLATVDFPAAAEAVDTFHRLYEVQWFSENKPNGYERHDTRLGGLAARLRTCAARLAAFARGEIGDIPELAEEVLPAEGGDDHLPYEQEYRVITLPL